MRIAIIGDGAIARYVRSKAPEHGHEVCALLLRPERAARENSESLLCVDKVADFPADLDHVVDCAGHTALRMYGPDILGRGTDLTTVSIGALADASLATSLEAAATAGGSRLHLASGAIGALDGLRAARVGKLNSVVYLGRKPPAAWRGSPAETRFDLENLPKGEHVHFEGSARQAATDYPKNANVAAAVALSGIGFDATQVRLIADTEVNENIHEIHADGEFGSFSFVIRGESLAANPKSSALAAMSVLSALEQSAARVVF